MAQPLSVPEKEFSDYFRTALKKPLPDLVPFESKLRVSGFPFCGLKTAWYKMTNHVEPDSDAMKDYYCNVGTAAHAVYQRWMGAHGKIYGDWECANKKCRKHVHFSNKHRCPKCGSEMRYEEFTIRAFKHVSGHTDGLFEDKHGEFWVIDYKTSSTRVIENQYKYKSLPYTKNKHQIEAYVPLLEKQLGIKIAGWMLLYVSRDSPEIFKVVGARMSPTRKHDILERIELYDAQYDTVLELKNLKQLKFLVDTKFCVDREHYERHMKGFNACPLEAVCFGKHLKPNLRIQLEDYLEKL